MSIIVCHEGYNVGCLWDATNRGYRQAGRHVVRGWVAAAAGLQRDDQGCGRIIPGRGAEALIDIRLFGGDRLLLFKAFKGRWLWFGSLDPGGGRCILVVKGGWARHF